MTSPSNRRFLPEFQRNAWTTDGHRYFVNNFPKSQSTIHQHIILDYESELSAIVGPGYRWHSVGAVCTGAIDARYQRRFCRPLLNRCHLRLHGLEAGFDIADLPDIGLKTGEALLGGISRGRHG